MRQNFSLVVVLSLFTFSSAQAATTVVTPTATSAPAASSKSVPVLMKTEAKTSHEDWKGVHDTTEWQTGVLLGLGVFESHGGFTVLGSFSKQIISGGFIPDLNNPISLEVQMGPLWVLDHTAFTYSTHLRWDFVKDDRWTFYGLGGFGGNITGESLGSRFTFLPRFGMGTILRMTDDMSFRAELSHELIALGAGIHF